jgi:hypothetical protein
MARLENRMTWDGTALYIDDGKRITTHSMMKTMLRCPKQMQYKYAERLKPKMVDKRDKPLRRGTWFHELLQEYYAGRSWKAKHNELTLKYYELMDEEQMALGDLPRELYALMRAYLWHYGADKTDRYHGWRVIGTEITLECPWPDSPDGDDIYRCRVDLLEEDEWGMWIVDHKTHKRLPDTTLRLLDAASPLYIWCARENGYPVNGFVWNYINTTPPGEPTLAYEGTVRERLSKRGLTTDYPTMLRGLRRLNIDPTEYLPLLRSLHAQRWQHGQVQTSPFFRRDTLEKDDATIAQVVGAAMRTRDRIHEYNWDASDNVERSVDRSCAFMCGFTDLCTTELFGGDAATLRRRMFKTGDPLDYYQDTRPVDQ